MNPSEKLGYDPMKRRYRYSPELPRIADAAVNIPVRLQWLHHHSSDVFLHDARLRDSTLPPDLPIKLAEWAEVLPFFVRADQSLHVSQRADIHQQERIVDKGYRYFLELIYDADIVTHELVLTDLYFATLCHKPCEDIRAEVLKELR